MMIKSATTLRNDYDKVVRLSKEKQELWEKREAKLNLLTELLRRKRNRIAGVRTFSMDDMRCIAEEVLNEN